MAIPIIVGLGNLVDNLITDCNFIVYFNTLFKRHLSEIKSANLSEMSNYQSSQFNLIISSAIVVRC